MNFEIITKNTGWLLIDKYKSMLFLIILFIHIKYIINIFN